MDGKPEDWRIVRSKDFGPLQDALHRRPSLRTLPPAMTRCRSWWIEPAASDPRDPATVLAAETEALRALFERLYRLLQTHLPRKPDHAGIEHEESAYFFSGPLLGLFVRCVLSKHSDRVSLTQVIDLGKQLRDSPEVGVGPNTLFTTLTNKLDHMSRLLVEHGKGSRNLHGSKRRSENCECADKIQEYTTYLFEEIWSAYDQKLNLEVFEESGTYQGRERLFLDFRGLLLPDRVDSWCSPSIEPGIPHHRPRKEDTDWDHYDALHRHWPIVRAMERGVLDDEAYRFKDMIACSMLDGQAIYVSSLGSPSNFAPRRSRRAHGAPAPDSSDDAAAPGLSQSPTLRFLIISKTHNRRQIGRLVDRLHRLGTFRLLALRNNIGLQNAGDDLKRLGLELDALSGAVVSRDDDADISRLRSLREFATKFQAIGRNSDVHGALPYRIYRCSTYAHSFKGLVPSLRSSRIEGFQEYGEYVSRQLDSAFLYIEQLGIRLDRLQQRFLTLIELEQTTSIRNLGDDTRKLQTESVAIQRVGELVELVAVSYYLGSLVEKIFIFIFMSFSTKIAPDGSILDPNYVNFFGCVRDIKLTEKMISILSFIAVTIIWVKGGQKVVHRWIRSLKSKRED